MAKIAVYPYKMGSQGAKRLAKELGVMCVFPNGKFMPKKTHLVINWGNQQKPKWANYGIIFTILNRWDRIANACNKIKAFTKFKELGVPCPEFTEDQAVAKNWLAKGNTVIGRQKVAAQAGAGIVVFAEGEKITDCPLYTKYKKKAKEFRVHVFNGKVIDFQEKRRKQGHKSNSLIRTEANGWVFCRQGAVLGDAGKAVAIQAVAALDLVFGGVDLIWNQKEDKYYVLEVNTAPGIEGTTVLSYAKAIKKYIQEKAL